MKLYYGQVSGNSARALFGLFESGVPFEPNLIDTTAGEHQSPGYLALNPMGKIPALSDGDFFLWESNAINLYAAEKNPASKLIPESPQARASMHRWLLFQSAHVSPPSIHVFRFINWRVQDFWKTKGDAIAYAGAIKELARFLPVLEKALDGRDWLEGTFSLADIAYAPHMLLIREGGFDFSPYPNITAWMTRLAARPAWQKTAALVGGPV
jgi:glutathione S-transferase